MKMRPKTERVKPQEAGKHSIKVNNFLLYFLSSFLYCIVSPRCISPSGHSTDKLNP